MFHRGTGSGRAPQDTVGPVLPGLQHRGRSLDEDMDEVESAVRGTAWFPWCSIFVCLSLFAVILSLALTLQEGLPI